MYVECNVLSPNGSADVLFFHSLEGGWLSSLNHSRMRLVKLATICTTLHEMERFMDTTLQFGRYIYL